MWQCLQGEAGDSNLVATLPRIAAGSRVEGHRASPDSPVTGMGADHGPELGHPRRRRYRCSRS